MTPVELISKLSNVDTYELLIWLKFLANKKNCRDCIAEKKLRGIIPECHFCIPTSTLIKQNFKSLKKEKNNENPKQK